MTTIPPTTANPYQNPFLNNTPASQSKEDIVQEIQEKGLRVYIKEKQEEEIYARARQKVLSSLNLDEGSLKTLEGKMSSKDYSALLQKIEDMIREEIENNLKKETENKVNPRGTFSTLV